MIPLTADGRRAPDLAFDAIGVPAPEGSQRGFVNPATGRVAVVHDNARTMPWRQAVAVAARQQIRAWEGETGVRWVPLTGAVHIAIEFYMPRPKSASKTRRTLPITKPDVDKLTRAALDALAHLVWNDDNQVTDLSIRERYAVTDTSLGHAWEYPVPGARISVFQLDPEETWADRPLEQLVAAMLPVPVLPAALQSYLLEVPDGDEPVFIVERQMTDAQALTAVKRSVVEAERRIHRQHGTDGSCPDGERHGVVLVVEDGVSRLASVPGRPLSALQLEVCAAQSRLGCRGAGLVLRGSAVPMPETGKSAA